MSIADDIFEGWLETGTLRKQTVTVYADQAAADELEALTREFAGLEKATTEQTMGDAAPLTEWQEKWDAAKVRWEASKATFVVERLPEPIRLQIQRESPTENAPRPLGTGATEKRKAEWDTEFKAWRQRNAEAESMRGMLSLCYSIASMTTAKGEHARVLSLDGEVVTPALTVAQLEALFASPYGDQWKNILTKTLNEISSVRGEPERPFSPSDSGKDQA